MSTRDGVSSVFMDSRLSVALAKAQYVRKAQVSGGSRAVNEVIDYFASTLSRSNYIDTNPPPAPGSTLVHNKAIDVSENPMVTGAGDAEIDNKIFSWIASLGGGLFPATAGLDVARYATALTMDRVQAFLFKQYSTFWSQQFQRIIEVVLSYQERFGSASYSTKDVSVSIDTFSLSDLPDMVNALTPLLREMVAANTSGLAPSNVTKGVVAVLLRPILQALGTSWTDTQDLTSEEAWEMGDFEPEPEPEPEPPPMMMPPQMIPQVQEEPEEEEPEMEAALRMVAQSYADGSIDAETLAENVIAAMVERRNGNS